MRTDHPRSRGVYPPPGSGEWTAAGSSPLARGLRTSARAALRAPRIIPARAGFTRCSCASSVRARDHPRSRGVYRIMSSTSARADGSSPLARGLPDRSQHPAGGPGIIPARAGFTPWTSSSGSWSADHPRSRGVYNASTKASSASGGSSPLARGLLRYESEGRSPSGIIPARAGFTPRPVRPSRPSSDHPRSRGVYQADRLVRKGRDGSSPLAQGLHERSGRALSLDGIIPARAGFTLTGTESPPRSWDHPRSRGVYVSQWVAQVPVLGSSPLARGLLQPPRCRHPGRRIIPARAGFTARRAAGLGSCWDHPRSRGVYQGHRP